VDASSFLSLPTGIVRPRVSGTVGNATVNAKRLSSSNDPRAVAMRSYVASASAWRVCELTFASANSAKEKMLFILKTTTLIEDDDTHRRRERVSMPEVRRKLFIETPTTATTATGVVDEVGYSSVARGMAVKDDAATVDVAGQRGTTTLERTMSSGASTNGRGDENSGDEGGGGSPMLSPIVGANEGEDGRKRREEDAPPTPESPNLRPAAGDAGSGMYEASFRFDDDDDNDVSRSSDAVSFESANVSMAVNTTRGSEFHSMYRTADLDEFSDDEFSASSKRRRPRLFGVFRAVKPLLAFVAGFITVSLVVGEVHKRREREDESKEDGRTVGR